MKRLAMVGLLSGLGLFGPLFAQEPKGDAKTELQKIQDEQKRLTEQAEKLDAIIKAEAAGKTGKEPPLAGPIGNTGYKPPTPAERRALHLASAQRHGNRLAMMHAFQTLPAAFDCREKGWVIQVGDQGNCGSCYLYATIWGTLTSAFIRGGYGKPDGSFIMAVQYGMDRPRNFGGCNGGYGLNVADWIMKNGWVAEAWVDLDGKAYKDYPPYEARSGSDRTRSGAKVWKIADYGFATGDQANRPATVDEIKTALWNYGPLNVALDAGGQFSNGTGTITQLGSSINHEIEITGWDDNDQTFTLKNQWSKGWGVNGYRKISYAASKRLVDIFWITVTPLPAPPPITITASVPDGIGKPRIEYSVMPIVVGGTTPYSWSFDYGDGTKGALLTHTYAANGVYTVVGTVTDSKGLTAGDTGTVTIGAAPPPPPPDGEYPQIIVDRTLQPGTYIALPKSVLDRLRVLDAERNQLLNPSNFTPLPLPEIKDK